MPKENYRFPGPGLPGEHIKVDVNSLDDFFKAAAELAVIGKQCTASILQRKLGLGYIRACRVMDQLEATGIIGPQNGIGTRSVLVKGINELHESFSRLVMRTIN